MRNRKISKVNETQIWTKLHFYSEILTEAKREMKKKERKMQQKRMAFDLNFGHHFLFSFGQNQQKYLIRMITRLLI